MYELSDGEGICVLINDKEDTLLHDISSVVSHERSKRYVYQQWTDGSNKIDAHPIV
ncbi:MAG: hypothetical protein IJA98_01510 [Bacteroidaceae bacterium]|nr:hypothetical protein [Bacteroidaceae bacterium]MBQ7966711.1 hypothetical protein [Bacteroidaceae bacterium]